MSTTEEDVIETEAVSEVSLPVDNSIQEADIKIVIDENDAIIETQESSSNIDSKPSHTAINEQSLKVEDDLLLEDEWGNKVRHKDCTGIHEKEQIPVNPKAIEMLANFLQGLKGKKGGRK